jgi:hypothetical protein
MQCDVTDLQGNHCPEEAAHTVVFDGVETHLCERCHANVLAGAYGSHLTQREPDALRSVALFGRVTTANAKGSMMVEWVGGGYFFSAKVSLLP